MRTRVMRLNSKIVPSRAIAGGKKSLIDGMCGPLSSPEAASSRIVATVDRTHSWVRGGTAAARVREVEPDACGPPKS
jgi:hypothetical protein